MSNTPTGKTDLPESVSRIQDSKDRIMTSFYKGFTTKVRVTDWPEHSFVFSGVCIYTNHPHENVGDYAECWAKDAFVDQDNKPGIKMSTVYWTEINEDLDHPLYDLQQKINNLDCNDTDSVIRFFEQMTVPTGFYATTTQDEWGTWIQFMREVAP